MKIFEITHRMIFNFYPNNPSDKIHIRNDMESLGSIWGTMRSNTMVMHTRGIYCVCVLSNGILCTTTHWIYCPPALPTRPSTTELISYGASWCWPRRAEEAGMVIDAYRIAVNGVSQSWSTSLYTVVISTYKTAHPPNCQRDDKWIIVQKWVKIAIRDLESSS